ncbi:MAG: hypothetical protein U9N40_00165 [Euryarchaeota archaeon]|nr:hypothetical protein [Euryarchaeota archaeon]
MYYRVNTILGMKRTADVPKTDHCKEEADRIQRFFVRPFFLSFTIGIPFCIFKLLFGLTAVRIGMDSSPALVWFGWFVIVWAAADLLMNTGRSVLDLFGLPAPFEYCTIAQAGHIVGRPLVFLAVDTLLSFAIICFMLWSGWITELSTVEACLWFAATTMNLISLSVVSIYNEVMRERESECE